MWLLLYFYSCGLLFFSYILFSLNVFKNAKTGRLKKNQSREVSCCAAGSLFDFQIQLACLSDHCEVRMAIYKGLPKVGTVRLLSACSECWKADGEGKGIGYSCTTRLPSETLHAASSALLLYHFSVLPGKFCKRFTDKL